MSKESKEHLIDKKIQELIVDKREQWNNYLKEMDIDKDTNWQILRI